MDTDPRSAIFTQRAIDFNKRDVKIISAVYLKLVRPNRI